MPAELPIAETPEFRAAYVAHERDERIRNGKIGCPLVIVLMLAGVLLDMLVYPAQAPEFFALRILCVLLMLGLWYLHTVPFAQEHYRWMGLLLAILPAYFIAVMIAFTELRSSDPGLDMRGVLSPYYAGLTLIMFGMSVVVRWNFRESVVAVLAVLFMYAGACLYNLHTNLDLANGDLMKNGVAKYSFNNGYFILLTGVIVAIGNHMFNKLRFQEFLARYELDLNRLTLDKANQRLRELDEVKSRFFANISHELRTPLTLLLAPMETLLHRKSRLADTEIQELLHTMQANGMRLLKLINDLLDLVRLDSGTMEIAREPVVVATLLKGLIALVRPMAQAKGLAVESVVQEDVDAVLMDRDKVEKTLLNLLFNAIKFTPAGGRIDLRSQNEGEWLALRVVDTGVGLSKEMSKKVFVRFSQEDDSSKRKYQGVGIGLALVKELTEIQGGSVAVESEEGKGSTFIVRLPYLKPEPATQVSTDPAGAETTQPPQDSHDTEWLTKLHRRAELYSTLQPPTVRREEVTRRGTGPIVLIADDELDMLRFLKSQFSGTYEVLEAIDGDQAVEKAAQFLPDIVLCDMMMPGKDGLQVCRELRSRTSTRNIPLLLITARADEETKMAALEAGASDFLSKPFSLTELHVRLKNLVESYQFQKHLARQNQILESTIEQLKETQAQLVASEKMASLGRLSAGIMHEINNPLNFMKTGLHVLKAKRDSLPADERPEYEETVADLADGISRVQGIVAALRSFAHPSGEKFDKVRADHVVNVALKLLSNDLKDGVNVQLNLADDHVVWANQNRLVQVLMNLIQNAAFALKKKEFANGDRPTLWIESKIDNGADKLVIRDNGIGIRKENLEKIFEPFFTTKDIGEGMGLGLSICYQIIQEHEGRILVVSEPGNYCEFTIELPKPRLAAGA